MLQYEYQALDPSKNEIRIVRFPGPIKEGEHLVQCNIQHVSLDQTLPEYKAYLQETEPFSPTIAIEDWLNAEQSSNLLPDHQIKAIVVDAWRHPAGDAQTSGENTVPVPPRFTWGDFEAVSYCWESDVRDKVVLIGDYGIRVPTSLEAMLRELQRLPEARSGIGFWVDGLCINQSDILEKNHQVSLMQRIYCEALSTVVWLGPGDEGSNQAIEVFKTLHRDYLAFSLIEVDGKTTILAEPQREFSGIQWMHVLDLWSRNYFKRMWIIQELAMNKTLSMFMCGIHRFTRSELRQGTTWAREHAGAISRTILKDVHPKSLPEEVDHDYVWRLANHVADLIRLDDTPSIDHIFNLARKSQATDPRDKVYGLLGLLPTRITSYLKPDYSKSVEEVYTDLAISLLRSCSRLDEVLSWCAFTEGSTLPSWVPDWTTSHQRNHLQWLRKREAGGNERPVWSLRNRGKSLCLRGVKVDRIESSSRSTSSILPYRAVSPPNPALNIGNPTFGRYLNKPQLTMALDRTILQDHPHRYEQGDLTGVPWIRWGDAKHCEAKHLLELIPGVTDQWKIFDRFRQSNADFNIFGHTLQDFFPNTGDYSKDLVYTPIDSDSIDEFSMVYGNPEDDGNPRLLRVSNLEHGYNNHHASNIRRAAVALQKRRLITTRTGFLGLAPDEVKIGDTVAILLGCNHPVVLRPHEDGFKYVGECYIHGLMDGEAVEAAYHGECQFEDISIV
ncbi:hypothetical protein BU25DRAFT_409267 [Macroventuria anomochaeta]|uniref:Uncharacterized protein n=1 Tax=Macroventuria anomochaeta TaxID=301207 RepID=A0ACB6S5C1_9PLEO|nr:uncharacterized protein BU25DRAFT_409267 [Macroventuria anomochaeta]KAF2629366.1 hypothetical protein BU25DRAFT_409267 [Macroventuria anomochaeta]